MTNGITDLSSPSSIEAEQAVLGAIMVDGSIYSECAALVTQADFFLMKHQQIWRACIDLNAAGTPLDILTVSGWLGRNRVLEAVGGLGYLTSLLNVVSINNAPFYAQLVQRAALRRRMMVLSDELKALARDETIDTEEILATAVGKIADLKISTERAPLVSAMDAADDEYERVEGIMNGQVVPFVPTSLAWLRYWMGGYQAGEMYGVAARPGFGKTTLLQTEMLYQAKLGHVVVFACLEQDPAEIMRGLICMEAGLPYDEVTRASELTALQFQRYTQAHARLRELPIWFADQERLTPATLTGKVKTAIMRYRAEIVYVDYIGLMEDDGKSESRTQELASMSRKLKRLAKTCHIPVVVAAQLNRGSEGMADRKPTLINIQGSDGLGFDSSVVLVLWRSSDVDLPTGEGAIITGIACIKNRHGRQGEGSINLHVPSKQFKDIKREDTRK